MRQRRPGRRGRLEELKNKLKNKTLQRKVSLARDVVRGGGLAGAVVREQAVAAQHRPPLQP